MKCNRELRTEAAKYITRRWFLQQCGVGLGSIALASLLGGRESFGAAARPAAVDPLAPRLPHFQSKAKRVIYLFMGGAPSQLDLFDHKPSLKKYNGQPVPKEVVMGQKYAFIKPDAALFASEFKFAKHGRTGDHQVHDDRRLQSCARPGADADRLDTIRAAMPGCLDALRPGKRSAKPAGIRRAQFRGRSERRRGALRRRLSADRLPGRAVPQER